MDNVPINTFFNVACSEHDHTTRLTDMVTPDEEGDSEEDGDRENSNISSNMNLTMPKSRLDVRKYSFSHRVVSPWNNLPNTVKQAESVNSFKNLYDEHLK